MGVGAVVVGAVVGVEVDVGVGAAVVGAAVDGLGAAVVGAAVRWIVGLGEDDAEALGEGDGDAVVPARRDSPPPKSTPMRRSVRRPPATAARIRSIQRGPRRGGGMILVVSDMPVTVAARVPRRQGVGLLFAWRNRIAFFTRNARSTTRMWALNDRAAEAPSMISGRTG